MKKKKKNMEPFGVVSMDDDISDFLFFFLVATEFASWSTFACRRDLFA